MFIIHSVDKTVTIFSDKIKKIEIIGESDYLNIYYCIKINDTIIYELDMDRDKFITTITKEKIYKLKDDIVNLLLIDKKYGKGIFKEYHITTDAKLERIDIDNNKLNEIKKRLWDN